VVNGRYAFLLGPMLALLVVGVLALLLRWAFSTGHSLVERRARPGPSGSYGLLVPVFSPGTFIEAEMAVRRLSDAGLKATLAPTTEGPRVLVFPEDLAKARGIRVEIDDPVAYVRDFGSKIPNARPSMLLDHLAGRMSEIDFINGAIPPAARAARSASAPTKPPGLSIRTANASPASSGVVSGVTSPAHTRYPFSSRSESMAR